MARPSQLFGTSLKTSTAQVLPGCAPAPLEGFRHYRLRPCAIAQLPKTQKNSVMTKRTSQPPATQQQAELDIGSENVPGAFANGTAFASSACAHSPSGAAQPATVEVADPGSCGARAGLANGGLARQRITLSASPDVSHIHWHHGKALLSCPRHTHKSVTRAKLISDMLDILQPAICTSFLECYMPGCISSNVED